MQPKIPLQQGANLSALSYVEDETTKEVDSDKEIEALANALDIDPEEVEAEVIELEDGSVVVNMTETEKPSENPEFYANLAEVLPDSVLDALAFEYLDLIDVDRESRKQRDKQYEEGIRRTGMGNDAPGGATFQGASKVVHPIMAEACVDFAANASKELLPADGLVRTYIKGKANQERIDTAQRKANFLNWQLTEQIEDGHPAVPVRVYKLLFSRTDHRPARHHRGHVQATCRDGRVP